MDERCKSCVSPRKIIFEYLFLLLQFLTKLTFALLLCDVISKCITIGFTNICVNTFCAVTELLVLQRVLNGLKRTRLSHRRIIGSSPTPSPKSPISKLSLFLGLLVYHRSRLLTGGGREWERSQIIRRRESLVLYKLFNTRWYPSYMLCILG